MFFGQTFLRAKQNLFNSMTEGVWKIKHYGATPTVASLREFTEAEKQDKNNKELKGVRTFYFPAHHWRGLPTMKLDKTEYDDFAWVPKRQMNEYFSKEYYDVFVRACTTR